MSLKKSLTLKEVLWTSCCSALYLILTSFFIGFKTEQIILILLFNILYYLSPLTRKFILGFLIFIVFWILFDSMKAFPNYRFNIVHIKELYFAEKKWFGINSHGTILTPNEFAQLHTTTGLDVIAGLFYLNWVPIPLIFAFYLFRKNKMQFLYFSLSFLLVNIIGFIIYYIYPAAPPWYVQKYGFLLNINTPGNTAGLGRFDIFFGINLFGSLYAKSSNVFAAMPSLHSAYPVIVFYYGLKNKLGYINILFFIFMIGIWFAAIYSFHHYTLDVLVGVLCAIMTLFIFNYILVKQTGFKSFLIKYSNVIS